MEIMQMHNCTILQLNLLDILPQPKAACFNIQFNSIRFVSKFSQCDWCFISHLELQFTYVSGGEVEVYVCVHVCVCARVQMQTAMITLNKRS